MTRLNYWERIRSFFVAPQFGNDLGKNGQAKLLNFIIWSNFFLLLPITIQFLFDPSRGFRFSIILITMQAFLMVCRKGLLMGELEKTSVGFICGGVIFSFWGVYNFGTLFSPIGSTLLLSVLLSVILLDRRGSLIAITIIALGALGAIWLEQNQMLMPIYQIKDNAAWFSNILIFLFGLFLFIEIHGNLRNSLGEAQELIRVRAFAEAALAESEARFRMISENAVDVIWVLDLEDLKFTYLSPSAKQMFGYTPEEGLKIHLSELVTPESMVLVTDGLQELVDNYYLSQTSQSTIQKVELDQYCMDGSILKTEAMARLLVNETGRFEVVGVTRDITERTKAEKDLIDSERKYRIVADNTQEWEFWMDPDDQYVYISPYCEVVSGFTSEEFMVDKDLSRKIVFGEDLPLIEAHNDKVKQQLKDSVVFRIVKKDGKERWINHICLPVYDENGGYLGNRGINQDITERRIAEEALLRSTDELQQQLRLVSEMKDQLQDLALHDSLTGLHNRYYLTEILEIEMARAKREKSPVSFILLDLDNFKRINDTFGHLVGDQFLVALSEKISAVARESDIVCRFGGEEFLLVMTGANLDVALSRAEELRKSVEDISIDIDGIRVGITISIGVSEYPAHGEDSEDTIEKADKALYVSKQNGRNRVTSA
jgi:diguanylate cyclase (GGDEF)-like protein/PAS domain S-box-containing protein